MKTFADEILELALKGEPVKGTLTREQCAVWDCKRDSIMGGMCGKHFNGFKDPMNWKRRVGAVAFILVTVLELVYLGGKAVWKFFIKA